MTGKILTALTRIEADTHWSNGRINKALNIYKSLLSSSANMTLETKAAIEAKIELLNNELDNPNPQQENRYLDAAIQKLQNAMDSDKSVADLRNGVKNYYKKGLYADALENLKQLIRQNAADEFCVSAVAACITNLYTLEELAVGTALFLTEAFDNAERANSFKIMLAEKMVKKGRLKQAQILHQNDSEFTSIVSL